MKRQDLLKIINNTKKENSKILNLSIQGITEQDLQDIINDLDNFTEINLSGNMLKKLPSDFSKLVKLEKLNLSTNYINSFPSEITYLSNLKILDLRDNQFDSIDTKIINLQKLEALYIKGNPLKKIPKVVFELKNLKILGIVNTNITEIPNDIYKLKNLVSLWAGKNRIKKLPNTLLSLNNLKNITLDENPLPIPKSILNYSKDTKIIFDYYLKYKNSLLDNIYESKIIIIGESQSGKTSLLNRLVYNKFYNDESKTDSINIDDWNIHVNNKIITANIWDFGGQDILYSLHKFFLTKNCIYILVWDARNENQSKKIEKWLTIIKQISNDAHVLLVMNKLDEQNTSIDKIYFEKIKSNITFFNISCKNNWNIDKIENKIKDLLTNNKNLIVNYNKKYLTIKKELKSKKEYFITKEEFDNIIYKNKLNNLEKNNLIKSFIELGIFLNYKNNFRLKDIFILNINWFIEGIYVVINWVSKNSFNGEFKINDIEKIFSETNYTYTDKIIMFIIDSLLYFNVIFEKNNTFYIPNLLEYYNKDIEKVTSKNYSKFKLNTKYTEKELFYELLVKYSNTKNNIKFYKNIINFQYKNNTIYIHLNQKEEIFIYINKKNTQNINKIIEFILEDIKQILNKNEIDINIILPDNSQISILYLQFLMENGYNKIITEKFNTYYINDIFGKMKLRKNLRGLTNIYIEKLSGDVIGDNAIKNIKG